MTAPTEKAAPIPAKVLALARLASIEIGEWVVDRSRKHPRDIVADLLLADRASQEERIREDERLRFEGERRGLERARLDAIVAWHGNQGTEWRRKDNGPTATMTRPEEYVPLRALIPEAPAREGE